MNRSLSQIAILVAAGGISFATGADPGIVEFHYDETCAAAQVVFGDDNDPGRSRAPLAVGIDNTLESHQAMLPTSRLLGPTPFSRSRMTGVGDGESYQEITVFHDGRIAYTSDRGNVVEGRFRSARNIQLAAFRLSGNAAPVQIQIDCVLDSIILADPTGTAGKSAVEYSGRWLLTTVSNETFLDGMEGTIEYDSRYHAAPQFGDDFSGISPTLVEIGDGVYKLSGTHTKTRYIGYGTRYAWLSDVQAGVFAESMDPAENATLKANSGEGNGVNFRLSSPDPSVRFVIYEKENPKPRPDLAIGRQLTLLAGDNVYGAPASQKAAVKQGKRKKASFYLRLENDGPDIAGGSRNNAFTLRGPKKKGALRFQYSKVGGGNVSAAVHSGRCHSAGLFSGDREVIQVQSSRTKKSSARLKRKNKVNFVVQNPGGGLDINQALIKLR